MAMDRKTVVLFSVRTRVYLTQASFRVLLLLARPVVRWCIVGGFIVLSGWLAYFAVWRQFDQTVMLPPGVPPENPRLNTELLRSLDARRLQRTHGVRHTFSSFADRFVGAPPPAP